MKEFNMTGFIDSIETFGLVDGPGIRSVLFFSGCALRCKFCHNPEMWKKTGKEYSVDDVLKLILKSKPYFKRNNGGVTFSGGEPLLQVDFLIGLSRLLKQENIHIALDTAGVGIGRYEEILNLVDLVLFDVKYAEKNGYKKLTGNEIFESEKFIDCLNQSSKPVWIRQVIVPGLMDNEDYLKQLAVYLKKIKNIEKIEFLPFHHLGFSKYDALGISNPFVDVQEMDKLDCENLYQRFLEIRDQL